MAKNREGVTVHAMNPAPPGGLVFYASLPCDAAPSKGDGTNREDVRHRLVSILWDHLEALENPLRQCSPSSARAALPIQLVSGLLGRPHLLVGESRGPAVSFSEGGGNVWAALCGDESDIGIDLAGADEFRGAYPLHRVFQPEELHHTVKLTDGDVAEAAALLWSVKEAVVKALGCGFHLVDPRQITVHHLSADRGGQTFSVTLSGKAHALFSLNSGSSLWVHVLPQRKMWFSIALFKRRPAVHE